MYVARSLSLKACQDEQQVTSAECQYMNVICFPTPNEATPGTRPSIRACALACLSCSEFIPAFALHSTQGQVICKPFVGEKEWTGICMPLGANTRGIYAGLELTSVDHEDTASRIQAASLPR